MIPTPEVVATGLNALISSNPKQAAGALCSWYFLRGWTWANETHIGEALEYLDSLEPHVKVGSEAARAWLTHRARIDGHGFSVADVEYQQWRMRGQAAWGAVIGTPWPGGRSWRDLRLQQLVDQGWHDREIASVFGLSLKYLRGYLPDPSYQQPASGLFDLFRPGSV
jgi:hypothetical protein